MATIISEFQRTGDGEILPESNVVFDSQTQSSPEITYDTTSGEITFKQPGLYSVKWWMATETAPRGCVEFALVCSETGHVAIPASSPVKTGQLSGFGAIDIKTPDSTLALTNTSLEISTVFSSQSNVKAYLLITQLINAGGLVQVYHVNLLAADSGRDIIIGNVICRVQYASATGLAMLLRSASGSVLVDVKRSSQYDTSGVEGQSLNNFSLAASPQNMDPLIYKVSNEMHRTWIRQRDPDSNLWSLHEVDLFASAGGARVSICVYPIYENVDLSGI